MKLYNSIYKETSWHAFFISITTPSLRLASFKCASVIVLNFFISQYRAFLLPGRIPVSNADQPDLDKKIPFTPSWVTVYLDFTHFWIRMLSFLLRRYGRKAYRPVIRFIESIGGLYKYAALVYRKNLSTTKRPFYIARPRFLVIHLFDPHLLCVPSLHVMVAVHTYTMFSAIARENGEEEILKEQILEIKQGALAICAAVLHVKQHSVNCIPAALYAMTCYSPDLFPPEEAALFIEQLFSSAPAQKVICSNPAHPSAAPKVKIPKKDQDEIKKYILDLYQRFLSERDTAASWEDPIINFLQKMR